MPWNGSADAGAAIAMQEVAEPYIRRRAIRHLKGRVVFWCWSGTILHY